MIRFQLRRSCCRIDLPYPWPNTKPYEQDNSLYLCPTCRRSWHLVPRLFGDGYFWQRGSKKMMEY
ncbi:hypothetical protein ABZS29_12690 [Kribbella sp. NPDC005582]|uniref:hypothetical protein n=1 Tax=Kribbella sp. NPDC005582 TaxID=3156893 RepID=UPI0033B1F23E